MEPRPRKPRMEVIPPNRQHRRDQGTKAYAEDRAVGPAHPQSANRPRRHPILVTLSYVPGVTSLVALWFYMLDEEAPASHKLAILGSFAYLIWPKDIIGDLIKPFVGYMDDVAIFIGLVKFIGSETLKPFRKQARCWLRGKPLAEATKSNPSE